MGQRRTSRGASPRSDQQILSHGDDVAMLETIGRGAAKVSLDNRMQLRRLAREDLCLAGFGVGTVPTLLPRGQRIVAAGRGQFPPPQED